MKTWLQMAGRQRRVEVLAVDGSERLDGALLCTIDGQAMEVEARFLRPGVLSLIVRGRQFHCSLDGAEVLIDGERYSFAVDDPRSLRKRGDSAGEHGGVRAIKAPMPGRVVRVLVQAGDVVTADQGLIVIEAMKMQNELRSPKAGTVMRVAVSEGQSVQAGGVLIVVE